MHTLRTLGFSLLVLAFGLAACVDADRKPATGSDDTQSADNAPVQGFQDPSDEAMRDEVLREQLAEVTVLQREMTGTWRGEAREMLLDFERQRYEGVTPAGEPLEGPLRVVEEGRDYIVFTVGDEVLTARSVGEGQILISTDPETLEGRRFSR